MLRRSLLAVALSIVACKGADSRSSSGAAPPSASHVPEPPTKKARASAGLDAGSPRTRFVVGGLAAQGANVLVAAAMEPEVGSVQATEGPRSGALVSRVAGSTVTRFATLAGGHTIVAGLGVDGDEGVVVGGAFEDALDAGGTKLAAAGALDGFLVRLAKDGKAAWAKDLRGPKPKAPAYVDAIAVASDGEILVNGAALSAALPCEDPEHAAGADAVYRLDRNGRPKWKKRYDGDVKVKSLAWSGDGAAWSSGVFGGDMSFGGEHAKSPQVRRTDQLGTTFGSDFWVARVDASGRTTLLRSFGSASSKAVGVTLAGGPTGVVLAGDHEGPIDFGDGAFGVPGKSRLFVLALDAAGKKVFARSIEIPKTAHVTGVAADASGGATVTGDFTGTLDFGGVPLLSAGGSDLFLARFDASGKLLEAFRFGGSGDDRGGRVLLRDAGEAVVTGTLGGRVDLGAGELGKPGDLSAFVAVFPR